MDDEYTSYWDWEGNMVFQNEEIDSWGLDEPLYGYTDSSSPEGASSAASKNIQSERNRRKKINERLFALRSVVPNISKMDKASIIKDAIKYIQELQEEERSIQTEIAELESSLSDDSSNPIFIRYPQLKPSASSSTSPIEVLQLGVSCMGEKVAVVSLSCNKQKDTMAKLCAVFELLNLKILSAHVTAFSSTILKTVFVEVEEAEMEELQAKIETAIAALNDFELT